MSLIKKKEVRVKILELTLVEKRTEKRIKVRMRSEDYKVISPLFKNDFRVIHTKEVMKKC